MIASPVSSKTSPNRPPQGRLRVGSFLLLGLLLLTACTSLTPAATPVEVTPTPLNTGTPTATIVWFPATNTPTPYTRPTLQPTEEMRPAVGEILLEDDFDDADAWQTSQTSIGSVKVSNQHITLAIQTGRSGLQSLRNAPLLTDFYAEITINLNLCSAQDQAGFIFHANDAANYYRVLLGCDGQLRLERVRDYQFAVIKDWTAGSGFLAGPLQKVRLGVWMAGSEMRVFVNDIYQFSARDGLWTSGLLGVYARTSSLDPVSFSFSELLVREVDRFAAPRTPTPTPTVTPGK